MLHPKANNHRNFRSALFKDKSFWATAQFRT